MADKMTPTPNQPAGDEREAIARFDVEDLLRRLDDWAQGLTAVRKDCLEAAAIIRALSANRGQAQGGWIVGNGSQTQWRTWKDGWSDWTDKREEATRYHRREDAEAVHSEDEDAWSVVPYAAPEALDDDRADAERWRALLSSDRIRMMGCAGFDFPDDGPKVREPSTGIHLGVEIWDRHRAGGDKDDTRGRQILRAYVDHLRAKEQVR